MFGLLSLSISKFFPFFILPTQFDGVEKTAIIEMTDFTHVLWHDTINQIGEFFSSFVFILHLWWMSKSQRFTTVRIWNGFLLMLRPNFSVLFITFVMNFLFHLRLHFGLSIFFCLFHLSAWLLEGRHFATEYSIESIR